MPTISKQNLAVVGAPIPQLGRGRREETPESHQQTVQVLPDTEGKLRNR